jgi:hypothetical protein
MRSHQVRARRRESTSASRLLERKRKCRSRDPTGDEAATRANENVGPRYAYRGQPGRQRQRDCSATDGAVRRAGGPLQVVRSETRALRFRIAGSKGECVDAPAQRAEADASGGSLRDFWCCSEPALCSSISLIGAAMHEPAAGGPGCPYRVRWPHGSQRECGGTVAVCAGP